MNMCRGRVKKLVLVAALVATSFGMMGLGSRPAGGGTVRPSVPASAIPEPAGFVVFAVGAGVVGLALHRRSRRN